jgi:hypothetical protein
MTRHISNGPGVARPRRLLLCLDGVPHGVMLAAKSRGLFEEFGPPSRLLSPFPTMTNIALSTMLRASPPIGYESIYFNREAREIRRGIRNYIGRRTPEKAPSSYMDELDYQEPLAFEFLVYVTPETIWQADMRRFRQAFSSAPRTRDYFAFLKGTDGLLHIRGLERLEVALQSLDHILRDVRAFCGAETEIMIFSDHGMNVQKNRRVHLKTHLERNGYRVVDRFNRRDRQCVSLPAFGLIGFAALFCADEKAASSLADALVSLEGLDFSIHRDGPAAAMVKGPNGVARISRSDNGRGDLYRYHRIEGDPLNLALVVKRLEHEGLMDSEGYASDETWLGATGDHIYPDALSNVYSAIHGDRVNQIADLLISFRDGYYYGASFFEYIVSLEATHGNARQASSTAFLMSTHRELPPVIRASDVRPWLRE